MPKKRSSRPMRLPNGFGSIVKLSGNRRNPYMARPPVTAYRDNGSPITPKAIGYYPDWPAAYEALLEYRRNPYDVDTRQITFAEVFDRMIQEKKVSKKPLSKATFSSYRAAFKNCEVLHDMRFNDIRLNHLQGVVDDCPLKHASLELIVHLFHQMYDYALKYDIAEKDYSVFVAINIADDDEGGVPFTEAEISTLWENSDDDVVAAMLVLIYSGFRISAAEKLSIDFDKKTFTGGVKTKSGKNRIVPIHDGILELTRRLVSRYNRVLPYPVKQYREEMYKRLDALKIQKHTPHDCRHTFSWICDKYKVEEFSKKLMLGHSLGNNVTDKKYGHRTIDELNLEINKIICH